MGKYLIGFILGCLVMYIGPRKIVVQGTRACMSLVKVVQKEINHDRQRNTESN